MSLSFSPYPLIAGGRTTLRGRAMPFDIVEIFLDRQPVEPVRPMLLYAMPRPGQAVVDPIDPDRFAIVADARGRFEVEIHIPDWLSRGDHLIEARELTQGGLTHGAIVAVLRPEDAAAFYAPGVVARRLREARNLAGFAASGVAKTDFLFPTRLQPLTYVTLYTSIDASIEQACQGCRQGSEAYGFSDPYFYEPFTEPTRTAPFDYAPLSQGLTGAMAGDGRRTGSGQGTQMGAAMALETGISPLLKYNQDWIPDLGAPPSNIDTPPDENETRPPQGEADTLDVFGAFPLGEIEDEPPDLSEPEPFEPPIGGLPELGDVDVPVYEPPDTECTPDASDADQMSCDSIRALWQRGCYDRLNEGDKLSPVVIRPSEGELLALSMARSPSPIHHIDNRNSDFPNLWGNHEDGPRMSASATVALAWRRGSEDIESDEYIGDGLSGVNVGSDGSLYQTARDRLVKLSRLGEVLFNEKLSDHLKQHYVYEEGEEGEKDDIFCVNTGFWAIINPLIMAEIRGDSTQERGQFDKVYFTSGGRFWKLNADLEVERYIDLRAFTPGGNPLFSGGFLVSELNPRVIVMGVQAGTPGSGLTPEPTGECGPDGDYMPPLCGGTFILAIDAITLEILDVFDIAYYFSSLMSVEDGGINLMGHPLIGGKPGDVFQQEPTVPMAGYNDVRLTNSLAMGRHPKQRGWSLLYGIIEQNYLFAVEFDPSGAGCRYFPNKPGVYWRQFYGPSRSGSSPALNALDDRIYITTGNFSDMVAQDPCQNPPEWVSISRDSLSSVWKVDAATGRVMAYTADIGRVPSSCVINLPPASGDEMQRVFVSVMGYSILGFEDTEDRGNVYDDGELVFNWKTGPQYVTYGANTLLVGQMYYTPFLCFTCTEVDLCTDIACLESECTTFAGAFDIGLPLLPDECATSDRACSEVCGALADWVYCTQSIDYALLTVDRLNNADDPIGQVYFFTEFYLFALTEEPWGQEG